MNEYAKKFILFFILINLLFIFMILFLYFKENNSKKDLQYFIKTTNFINPSLSQDTNFIRNITTYSVFDISNLNPQSTSDGISTFFIKRQKNE